MKNCKLVNGLSMILVLHEQCNMNCTFCVETEEKGIREHKEIDLEYIRNLPDVIIKSVSDIIKANGIKNIEAYCIGGELLSDNISDEVFETYKYFITTLRERLLKEFNVNIVINLVSNGMFTKYDRVEEVLKYFETFTISYDPCDRFHTESQRQMWLKTYNYFKAKDMNLWISTVLTKKNINAYINEDEIFNSFPSNIPVEIQEYSPRKDYHDYLPNDDDIWNFYKWCLDHEKFTVSLIRDILEGISTCSYGRSYMFLPNLKKPYINFCIESSSLDKTNFYGNDSNDVDLVTEFKEDTFYYGLNKRGCLYCEYHGKCPGMCLIPVLFKDYKLDLCPTKRVYQYIENNHEIMDKYLKWKDDYKNYLESISIVNN